MSRELHTLISLLEDNDSEVYSAVYKELTKQGLAVIPKLEKVWETTTDLIIQRRLEHLIHSIQFSYTRKNIQNWINDGANDVLEGASFIAQLQYPNINYSVLSKEVEKIAGDIYLSAGNNLTAYEKVKLLNYVIFEFNNFSRNTSNYYSPQYSVISQVFQKRKGNPISLGIIYLAIADRLKLPIYGVNLPNSFVLAYMNEYRHSNDVEIANDVLFYINPYSKGTVLHRKEIDNFIKQQKLEPKADYYVPCDNQLIIQRLIINLMIAYEKMGFQEKNEPLKHLLADFQLQK
jgi:regulator of sirC expression with transglutaminase-like and TPR domain